MYKNGTRLQTPQDVRRVCQRLINTTMAENDSLTVSQLKAVNSLLNTSLKAMQYGDIEAKLEKIEGLLQERGESSW